MQYLQTFEANVIFATEKQKVFTLTFATNVCKYCTQDFNNLYVYDKAHIRMCDALRFMKIGWILFEKSQFLYLESSAQKKCAHFRLTRDIATL